MSNIPLSEVVSLIGQLEEHSISNAELLEKVKEPTLKARLEGKQMTYDYAIKKLELMIERNR